MHRRRSDSEGSLRATVDVNLSFGREGALRLNLLRDEDRNWVDTDFRNRVGATLAGTYRPWKAGEFRFEAETGDLKQNWATGSFTDGLSTWNGVPFVGPATSNPAGATGIGRFTTDRLIDLPGGGLVNLLNFGNTQGSNFVIEPSKAAYLPNLPSIGRNLSLQPANTVGNNRHYDTRLRHRLRPADHPLEAAPQRAREPARRVLLGAGPALDAQQQRRRAAPHQRRQPVLFP